MPGHGVAVRAFIASPPGPRRTDGARRLAVGAPVDFCPAAG